MTWALASEVQEITGTTPDDATLAIASSIISTVAGVDEDLPTSAITPIDRNRLKRATAWEAIWLPTKPGLLTERESARSVTSDGQSVQREDDASALLAPLARIELLRLSWIGTRSVKVPRADTLPARVDFLNEASDQYGRWAPIVQGSDL